MRFMEIVKLAVIVGVLSPVVVPGRDLTRPSVAAVRHAIYTGSKGMPARSRGPGS